MLSPLLLVHVNLSVRTEQFILSLGECIIKLLKQFHMDGVLVVLIPFVTNWPYDIK